MKNDIKKQVLQKLSKKMLESDGSDLVGGKLGVTVKADDKKSLIKGLKKAEDIVEDQELPEEMEEESEEDESEESEELSQEEILSKIECLKKMLKDKE